MLASSFENSRVGFVKVRSMISWNKAIIFARETQPTYDYCVTTVTCRLLGARVDSSSLIRLS